MVKAVAFVLSVLATLAGCASVAEQNAYARSLDDQQLCLSWMKSHPMNQYQGARAAEIRKRGLNCSQYGNVAEERRKANVPLSEVYNRGASKYTGNTATPSASAPMGFTNCVNRGAGVIECYGPKGMARCQSIGGGVIQCN